MTIDRADLTAISAFAAVARHRSFRRAADELGVSSSALSHLLRGLEARLGVRLLNRTTRSVSPTEAGERLLARVAPALEAIGEGLGEARAAAQRPAGRLRLNAAHPAAHTVLAPLFGAFRTACPDVHLEIVVDDGLVDVVADGFDAGIRLGERLAQDMVAVPLGPPVRSAVVVSPDHLAGTGRPTIPGDLAGRDCIRYRFPSGRHYAWEFEKDGREVSVDVDGPMTLGDQFLILAAARAGIGFGYVFEAMAEADLAAGRLVRVLDDWCPPFPGFFLYHPTARAMPPALRAFIDLARRAG